MSRCWRHLVLVMLIAAAIASGWVYPYLKAQPVPALVEKPSEVVKKDRDDERLGKLKSRADVWHGIVTRIAEDEQGRQKIYFEHIVWNIWHNRPYRNPMWAELKTNATVTDRRTQQPGKLAVGQRVSVVYNGDVYMTGIPGVDADRVYIEPDDKLIQLPVD